MISRIRNMSFRTMAIVMALFTLFVCCCGIGIFMSEGQNHRVYADDEEADDTSTLSFYSTASSFARVMGYIASPDYKANTGTTKTVEKNIAVWKHIDDAIETINSEVFSIGTASSLLGYFDAGDGGGFFGWLQTLASGTSTTYNYESLERYPNLDPDAAAYFNMYGAYGYGLSIMGFDETAGSSIGIVRLLGGAMFFGSFIVAFVIDYVFKIVLFVLKTINPFALFSQVASWSSFSSIDGDSSAFGGNIISMISSLYDAISDISIYVLIPVFVILLAFSFLVLRRTSQSKSMLKKVIIRLLFVAIGIPLLASIYTSSLEQLGEVTTGATNAVQVTAATFFDFEKWVYPDDGEPLAPYSPLYFTYNNSTKTIDLSPDSYLLLQDYCYVFNTETGAIPPYSGSAYSLDTSSGSRLESSLGEDIGSSSSDEIGDGFSSVVSLLTRYMSGAKISSSDYESYVKAGIDSSDTQVSRLFNGLRRVRYGEWKDDDNTAYGMFSSWSSDDKNDKAEDTNTVFYAIMSSSSELPLGTSKLVKGSMGGSHNGSSYTFSSGSSGTGGLSQLGTYNYLNTYFEEKSMNVYSPSNASSLFVMRQHYQVNMIGTGVMSFMYWASAIVMLWCLAIIGFFYGFGILFGNLKRGFKILLQVPFATLGAMKSIARVISWTFMMFIEIVVTLFLYSILSEIFFYIPKIIASPIISVMQGSTPDVSSNISLPGMSNDIGGYMLTLLILLLSIVAEIMFTIMAIKLRKTVVKAVDEEAARIIEQVIGVAPGAASELPKQPGLMGNMASNALAAGAMAGAYDRSASGSGAAFDKGAFAGDEADGVRSPVGTGDGGEESSGSLGSGADADGADSASALGDVASGTGSPSGAGFVAGDSSAPAYAAGSDSSMNNTVAQQDRNDKDITQQVAQMGSLGGNNSTSSSAGDVLTENNENIITYEGSDTEINNGDQRPLAQAESPAAVSEGSGDSSNTSDVVQNVAGNDASDVRSVSPDLSSGPIDLNNADVNKIADASRSSGDRANDAVAQRSVNAGDSVERVSDRNSNAPAGVNPLRPDAGEQGRPGEGGKGGDGQKGEDGRDAEESSGSGSPRFFRNAVPSSENEVSGTRDVQGVRAAEHSNGSTVSRIAPQAEDGVYRDEKGKYHHADGTPMSRAEVKAYKAEQKEQRAAARYNASESDPAAVSARHVDAARESQTKANAERVKASERIGAETAIGNARNDTVNGIEGARNAYQTSRSNVRSEADSRRQDNRQRDAAANERAFASSVRTRFPHAVDTEGQFHPEALKGVDKARFAVMQASHNIANGVTGTRQRAVDTAIGAKRAVQDRAVNTGLDVARGASVAATNIAETAVSATAGTAVRSVHAVKAASHQRQAVTSMRRSRTFIPGIGEQQGQRPQSGAFGNSVVNRNTNTTVNTEERVTENVRRVESGNRQASVPANNASPQRNSRVQTVVTPVPQNEQSVQFTVIPPSSSPGGSRVRTPVSVPHGSGSGNGGTQVSRVYVNDGNSNSNGGNTVYVSNNTGRTRSSSNNRTVRMVNNGGSTNGNSNGGTVQSVRYEQGNTASRSNAPTPRGQNPVRVQRQSSSGNVGNVVKNAALMTVLERSGNSGAANAVRMNLVMNGSDGNNADSTGVRRLNDKSSVAVPLALMLASMRMGNNRRSDDDGSHGSGGFFG